MIPGISNGYAGGVGVGGDDGDAGDDGDGGDDDVLAGAASRSVTMGLKPIVAAAALKSWAPAA